MLEQKSQAARVLLMGKHWFLIVSILWEQKLKAHKTFYPLPHMPHCPSASGVLTHNTGLGGQHEGGRGAHVRAALRHRLRTEG